MELHAHDRPIDVDAEEGVVIIDGPDGMVLSMTPEAAEETSQRLLIGAAKAKGQQIANRRGQTQVP